MSTLANTPPLPTCAPINNPSALKGAYLTTATVVSISSKPLKAASAASAAIKIGLSFTFVI